MGMCAVPLMPACVFCKPFFRQTCVFSAFCFAPIFLHVMSLPVGAVLWREIGMNGRECPHPTRFQPGKMGRERTNITRGKARSPFSPWATTQMPYHPSRTSSSSSRSRSSRSSMTCIASTLLLLLLPLLPHRPSSQPLPTLPRRNRVGQRPRQFQTRKPSFPPSLPPSFLLP